VLCRPISVQKMLLMIPLMNCLSRKLMGALLQGGTGRGFVGVGQPIIDPVKFDL
jgi:hypothetical protein